MPGLVVHQGAIVTCVHVGLATPTVVSPRVTIMGMPIVTMGAPYQVAGCTVPAMTSGALPCVTAQWTAGAIRVTSMGQPLVLADSTSICAPNGTPLFPVTPTQPRVTAM
jgi:hypothetical protein